MCYIYIHKTYKQIYRVKNAIFWVVTPCGSCKNRHFRGICHLHYQSNKNRKARNSVNSNKQPKHAVKKYAPSHIVFLRSMLRLLVTANVPSLLILVTLMMEVTQTKKNKLRGL
jgi:hypothetical protein